MCLLRLNPLRLWYLVMLLREITMSCKNILQCKNINSSTMPCKSEIERYLIKFENQGNYMLLRLLIRKHEIIL